MDTDPAWDAERQRLQAELIRAAERLLAQTGGTGFRVTLPDGRVLQLGDDKAAALLAKVERTARGEP